MTERTANRGSASTVSDALTNILTVQGQRIFDRDWQRHLRCPIPRQQLAALAGAIVGAPCGGSSRRRHGIAATAATRFSSSCPTRAARYALSAITHPESERSHQRSCACHRTANAQAACADHSWPFSTLDHGLAWTAIRPTNRRCVHPAWP